MQLLITLAVFVIGFMTFGAIFYGVAKFFLTKKMNNTGTGDFQRSPYLKVNKTHNVYSFK